MLHFTVPRCHTSPTLVGTLKETPLPAGGLNPKILSQVSRHGPCAIYAASAQCECEPSKTRNSTRSTQRCAHAPALARAHTRPTHTRWPRWAPHSRPRATYDSRSTCSAPPLQAIPAQGDLHTTLRLPSGPPRFLPYRAAELLPWHAGAGLRFSSFVASSSSLAPRRSNVVEQSFVPRGVERSSLHLREEGSILREFKVRWTVSGVLSMLDRCRRAFRGLAIRMFEVWVCMWIPFV
jgi:hypothetical protein